jgi:hypothetical protein
MHKIFGLILSSISIIFFSISGSAAGENTIYKKIIVKSRAERYKDTGGVSPASRDLYIYADDEDIQKSLDDIKSTPRSLREESINIVSPVIGAKSTVRNVNVVVDAKRGIKVDRRKLGIKDQEINIASPVLEEGSKVRDVNITVDAKRGGIEIK